MFFLLFDRPIHTTSMTRPGRAAPHRVISPSCFQLPRFPFISLPPPSIKWNLLQRHVRNLLHFFIWQLDIAPRWGEDKDKQSWRNNWVEKEEEGRRRRFLWQNKPPSTCHSTSTGRIPLVAIVLHSWLLSVPDNHPHPLWMLVFVIFPLIRAKCSFPKQLPRERVIHLPHKHIISFHPRQGLRGGQGYAGDRRWTEINTRNGEK